MGEEGGEKGLVILRLNIHRQTILDRNDRIRSSLIFIIVLCLFRAATIITREDGCQFLRVDKDDFNRILRDVEANTVRLKEHGRDVLVLEKVSANPSAAHRHSASSHYKYARLHFHFFFSCFQTCERKSSGLILSDILIH